jgi:hypothetical protein
LEHRFHDDFSAKLRKIVDSFKRALRNEPHVSEQRVRF